MKTNFRYIIISIFVLFLVAAPVSAADYQHSIDLHKMVIHWTVTGDSMNIKLVGKTKGWVAVGFNATRKMKNANIIIGYIKNGKIRISDDFGVASTRHKPDKRLHGKFNISDISGSEKGGVTTLAFTIPLNSGDKNDGVIHPNGNTRVIAALGKRDSFHFGHFFRVQMDVNLASGKYELK